MSLHRFFLERQSLSEEHGDAFVLDVDDGDIPHMKARRLKVHEHIAVIDAQTDYFECEILSFSESGRPIVRIASRLDAPCVRYEVALVQALSKSDRFDEVLRHATEVGIDRFIPLCCERSYIKINDDKVGKKHSRWLNIVKSAAVQSGRISIPEVSKPQDLAGLRQSLTGYDLVLLCWEQSPVSNSIFSLLDKGIIKEGIKIAVIVGPEGGFSEEEVDGMISALGNVKLMSLGKWILRTETAGVVASALTVSLLDELFAGGLGRDGMHPSAPGGICACY